MKARLAMAIGLGLAAAAAAAAAGPAAEAPRVIWAADFGVVADDGLDDADGLRRCLASASQMGGPVEVRLPPNGRLHLRQPASPADRAMLELRGAADLSLDGQGATLVCGDRERAALWLTACWRVQLRDLAFDYEPPAFTQGTLVARDSDTGRLTLAFDAGWPDLAADPWLARHCYALQPYDPLTQAPVDVSEHLYVEPGPTGNTVLPRGYPSPRSTEPTRFGYRLGSRFVLKAEHPSHRGALHVEQGGEVLLRSLVVWHSPAAGVYARGVQGLRIESCRLAPPPGRLLGVARDALFCQEVSGLRVSCCLVDRNGDDGIVTTTGWYRLGGDAAGAMLPMAWSPSDADLAASEALKVFALPAGRLLGSFRCTGRVPGAPDRLLLDRPCPARRGDLVCLSRLGSDFAITDNTVLHNRGNGIVIKYDDGVVRRNRIVGSLFCGIRAGPDLATSAQYAGSGKFVDGVTIAENWVEHCGYTLQVRRHDSVKLGAVTVAASLADHGDAWLRGRGIRNVEVTDNTILDSGLLGLFLAGVEGAAGSRSGSLAGNRIVDSQGIARRWPQRAAELWEIGSSVGLRYDRDAPAMLVGCVGLHDPPVGTVLRNLAGHGEPED